MNSEEKDKIVLLTLIAGRKQKDDLLSELSEMGTQLTCTIYGRGTIKASYLMNALGLVTEENKVLITCALTNEKSDTVLDMLTQKFNFNNPNTGIAFTMPIDDLSY